MAYLYPYGDTQQLNLDWLIEQWNEVKSQIDGSLQAEIDRVEAAITDLLTARDEAVAAQTAAQASAQAAAGSASTASGAASTATAQAQAAAGSAATAGAHASDAQQYMLTADQYAQAAQNSAGAAANSANTANGAKQDAQTYAQQASGYAQNAQGSAVAAQQQFNLADAARQAAQDAASDAADSAQEAQDILDSIPEDYSELSDDVIELKTASGYMLNQFNNVQYAIFNDALPMPPKTFQVDVQAVQAGSDTPTPSNPRALTGFSSASVYITGKNLLKFSRRDGESDTTHAISNLIPYYGKQLYFKNFDAAINGGDLNVRYYDINLNEIGFLRLTYNIPADVVYTLAPPANTAWIRFGAYRGDNAGGIDAHLTAQFMVSDDISAYEAFKNAYDITFPAEAGVVYKGTIDLITHKLIVNTAKVTYSSVSGAVEGNGFRLAATYNLPHIKQGYGYMVSNMFLRANSYGQAVSGSGTGANRLGYNNSGQILLNAVVNGSIITDMATLNNLISSAGGLDIVYEIDTPVEYDLTFTDISLFIGITHLWANTGNINVLEYYLNGKEYVDTLFNNIAAKRLPDMKADTALVANDFRIVGTTLYRITTSIASGATLIPNTNCTATTIAAVLKSLLS